MARYETKRSPEMAHAAAMLRAGQTRHQQDRAFLDKVLLHGTIAGIGAIGHAVEGSESNERQAAQRLKAKQTASMSRAIGDAKSRTSSKLPDYNPQDGNVYEDGPAWLHEGRGQEGFQYAGDPFAQKADPVNLSMLADKAVQNQSLNASALSTPLRGYETADSLDRKSQEAGSIGRDMLTGQSLIDTSGGGMRRSLTRSAR